MDYVFNHDGGVLLALSRTQMTELDAADMLVRPLAESDVNVIDWCIGSTAEHNCRTRHNLPILPRTERFTTIRRVIDHYNTGPLDILDIVVKHAHERGMKVYGCVRLNHCLHPERIVAIPGAVNFCHYNSIKKDFRLWAFHQYLAELFEDLLAKGVDGITLDFERKAPFFPPGAPQQEKDEACAYFLRRIRKLTDKPIAVRVAHEKEKGRAQGQDPFAWMAEGLVDVVIPATHNHEPDPLDWGVDEFLAAAAKSPRPCRVWPQIWPTGAAWVGGTEPGHAPEAVIRRTRDIVAAGADGVYYFNFCCYCESERLLPEHYQRVFRNLA